MNSKPPPPEHEVKILVRQVEPGLRVRKTFFQYKAVPIPDVEPVIHALFDLIAQRSETQSISGRELAELALRYAEATTAHIGNVHRREKGI